RVVNHLCGGAYAGQRVADVMRQHGHQQAERRLFLAFNQRVAAGGQVFGHFINFSRQHRQFLCTGFRHLMTQVAGTDGIGGLHDVVNRPDNGVFQDTARIHDQDARQDQRQRQHGNRVASGIIQPVLDFALFYKQQGFGALGNLFIVPENAGFNILVNRFLCLAIRVVLVAVKQGGGFIDQVAVFQLDVHQRIAFLLVDGDVLQAFQVIQDGGGVLVVFM
ncbi:conserved hypothetical protein, partial [Ricinus communis]